MALIDQKVSENYANRDISSLSDRPNEDGISTNELKARFTTIIKELTPKYNGLIDLMISGILDGATIVSAEFVGDNLVFTKSDATTVVIVDAKLVLKGDVGASINSASFISNDLVFVKDDTTTVTIADAKLSLKGDTGAQGTGLVIKGQYATLLDLQTAHPTGLLGDAWAVGTVENSDLYLWDTPTLAWKDVGQVGINLNANSVLVTDTGTYYVATDVEGVLQEIGAKLNPSASKTTPIDADTILISDSASSGVFKNLTWANIKATLKTYFDTIYQAILVSGTSIKTINSTNVLGSGNIAVQPTLVSGTNIKTVNGASILDSGDLPLTNADGWSLINAILTYASADSPTFVANTSVDLTSVISVGMKLKLTQTTVKYFIVTAITSTTITIYGGIDYTLANATITLPYFSSTKAPFGFPLNPDKWSVIATVTSLQGISNPVANQWYEMTNGNISIPIGLWIIYYQVHIYASNSSSTTIRARSTLSTTNNSETITSFTRKSETVGTTLGQTHYSVSNFIERLTKATYYLLLQAPTASYTTLNNDAGSVPLIIKAVCAYL